MDVFGSAGSEMAMGFLPGLFWRSRYRFAYYMPMDDPARVRWCIPSTERDAAATVQTVTTSVASPTSSIGTGS